MSIGAIVLLSLAAILSVLLWLLRTPARTSSSASVEEPTHFPPPLAAVEGHIPREKQSHGRALTPGEELLAMAWLVVILPGMFLGFLGLFFGAGRLSKAVSAGFVLLGIGVSLAMFLPERYKSVHRVLVLAGRPLAFLVGLTSLLLLWVPFAFVIGWDGQGVVWEDSGMRAYSGGVAVAQFLMMGVLMPIALGVVGVYLIRWSVSGWRNTVARLSERDRIP